MAYYPIADHSLGHSGWIMYTRSLSTKTLLFSFIITIGLLLLPIAAAAQSSSSSAPSATTGPSVTVLIHAADRQGAAVAISDKSLTVHAENEQVQVLELKPANIAPMRFVLLLDLSGSDRDEFELEKKAAAQLFGALSKGNSEGYVGVFSEEVVISTRPLRLQELNEFLDGVQAHGGTALYDAVIKACDQLSRGPGAPSSRRVMLVITDGEDNASRVRQADAVKIAQRDGVPVFAPRLQGRKNTHEVGTRDGRRGSRRGLE